MSEEINEQVANPETAPAEQAAEQVDVATGASTEIAAEGEQSVDAADSTETTPATEQQA